jgi:tetratricopeptide (TPR) repeat protein
MIRLLSLLLLLALPATAETARVFSGEHEDFTRLVIDLPQAGDWTVGRTPMGYAFAANASSQTSYDLDRVWDRIPRTRLQALRADPETGALQLTLACPCHVFPFEYRPGMVVLDIKDGPPPPGSSFEAAFTGFPDTGRLADGQMLPTLRPPGQPPALQGRYDWLAVTRLDGPVAAGLTPPLSLASGAVSLQPLRDELLEQISRGAAVGVVDMVLPGPPPDAPENSAATAWSQIRIGEMPGMSIVDPRQPEELTAEGGTCIADEAVNLPAWGVDRPPIELLSEARSGLYGEFDRVEPEAVMRSIRLHLYLGFGAEAAQIAELLDEGDRSEELRTYLSMARLVDGENDPSTPFLGMLGCDGAVALWAALALDRLPPGPQVNAAAIVRSFVALPPHLRRALGPGVADRLLQRGDADLARIVRDTIQRSPDSTVAEVALLDAKAELQADRNEAARDFAQASVDEGTDSPDPLIALVEAHFRDAEPLSPEIATALLAFQRETSSGAEAAKVQRALLLALALSDQTAAAFAMVEETGVQEPDLWQVAAKRASDDDFLREAVLSSGQAAPSVAPEVALSVASRLVDLGFPEAALAWLDPVSQSAPEEVRRVAAQAEFLLGDARATLDLLASLDSPEDQVVKAKALVQLGQIEPARQAFEAAGLPDEAARLLPWKADWPQVQAEGTGPWVGAAGVATVPAREETGPLARGNALVEESGAARAALDALLSAVPAPSP